MQIWVFGVQIYSDITQVKKWLNSCISAHDYRHSLTVEQGRINGGKLIKLSYNKYIIYYTDSRLVPLYIFTSLTYLQRRVKIYSLTRRPRYLCNNLYIYNQCNNLYIYNLYIYNQWCQLQVNFGRGRKYFVQMCSTEKYPKSCFQNLRFITVVHELFTYYLSVIYSIFSKFWLWWCMI